jgi:hypothetical protein
VSSVDPYQKVIFGLDCWFWTGNKNRDDYGVFGWGGVNVLAHRWFYEECVGPIPRKTVLMHTCDNPSCVNPAHLSIGTHSKNRRDTISKNRHAKGESMPTAKLTEDAVRDIRNRYAAGDANQPQLAKEYCVDQTLISHVVTGKSWRHVP